MTPTNRAVGPKVAASECSTSRKLAGVLNLHSLSTRRRVASYSVAMGLILMAAAGSVSAQLLPAEPANLQQTELTSSVVARAQHTISVTMPVGMYKVTETTKGHELFADGFGYLLVPGKPRLPSKIFALAIPPGAEVVAVSRAADEGVLLPGTYRVPPAPLPRVIGREDPAIYEKDRALYRENYNSVYTSNEAYPPEVVELVRAAGYRKHNLVDVRVNPFAYRPLSGRLTHYPVITVQVTYRPVEKGRAVVTDDLAAAEKVAQELILNHSQTRDWHPQAPLRTQGLHDFVIITLDSLVSSVTPLVDWETTKGRTVEVVTTTWIDANYGGYDLPEKMRNFLRDKYPSAEWGIEDVLLVGHYDDVPMRRTWQDLGYGAPETDFYYAELSLPDDQSWDADGDHQYGEDSDPIDFYAEVNVSRIPWTPAATVLDICQKSVAFEQNQDPAFKRNALLSGAFFWNDDPEPRTDTAVLMEAIANQPWMSDWTVTRMHEKNVNCWSLYACDYPLLHESVLSVWPSGKYAFVNWAGHGSPTSSHIRGLGAPAFIRSADCPSLSDAYPAIIFADACSNSDTDYPNIGRAMVGQGAVGFLGSTKVATGAPDWQTPMDGSTQSLDYFFATSVTSGNYTLGQAHQWALREMYTNGLWRYPYYETFEWGALAGNPNLSMAPAFLDITLPEGAPDYLAPGIPTSFPVQIEEGIEGYVPGTGTLHYHYDGGSWQTAPLAPQGGNLFQATLPASDCGDVAEYYVSADGTLSGTTTAPFDAPTTAYAAEVRYVTLFMQETFDADPGWSTQGQWAFGQPTGSGGEYGGPDPTGGHTGPNVYAYNLSGDYENSLPERHLTSTAINCTGRLGVRLSFWRWLGVEEHTYDHASVRVSNDGTNWVAVWQNEAEIADREWSYQELDISTVADDQPTVYLRWTMGASDGGWRYCGWNVDDVQLTSRSCEFFPLPGDFDNDGDVDLDDFDQFATCFTGPGGGPVAPGCEPGDFDSDGDIDCEDWNQFVLSWTEAQDPPVFLPCCEPCCGPDGPVSSAPLAEMTVDELENLVVSTKNRFLSFAAGDAAQYQLIRVKFLDLAPPYDQFNDRYMWVGEPFKVTESPAHTAPGQAGFADFWAAKLQCDKPVPMDFTTLTGDCFNGVCYHSENAGETCTDDSDCVRAMLHVYDGFVVPESKYEIRVLDDSCPWTLIDDDTVAPPLVTDEGPWLATSLWGDTNGRFVNGRWSAPDGQCSVPSDVIAVLWKVALGPLSKTRADVIGLDDPKNMRPDLLVGITEDVMRVLSACALRPFPADAPAWPCP